MCQKFHRKQITGHQNPFCFQTYNSFQERSARPDIQNPIRRGRPSSGDRPSWAAIDSTRFLPTAVVLERQINGRTYVVQRITFPCKRADAGLTCLPAGRRVRSFPTDELTRRKQDGRFARGQTETNGCRKRPANNHFGRRLKAGKLAGICRVA